MEISLFFHVVSPLGGAPGGCFGTGTDSVAVCSGWLATDLALVVVPLMSHTLPSSVGDLALLPGPFGWADAAAEASVRLYGLFPLPAPFRSCPGADARADAAEASWRWHGLFPLPERSRSGAGADARADAAAPLPGASERADDVFRHGHDANDDVFDNGGADDDLCFHGGSSFMLRKW